ncbi:hypothetical protein VitviT2T_023283 [Vitis vinifera]|uniref:Uncharacterized protein n=1 Tax=Vitis vinifera TaxID=29760 RepID=A0ABY9DEZ1_VITVI|nr:hypothetical protein VitviT2T_023283 [Vitis vinifera]
MKKKVERQPDRIPDARYPGKVERRRRRIPDTRYPGGMSAKENFGCEISEWNVGGENSGCEISGWNVDEEEFRMRDIRGMSAGRFPDARHPDGMSVEKNSRCEISGWNVGGEEFRI